MDPNFLIPFLLFSGSQEHMADILKRTLPVALPGPPGQRFALAAIVADKEFKRQDEGNKLLIQEVVSAAKIKDVDDFATKLPQLHAVFVKLPGALQKTISFEVAGSATGGQAASGSRSKS